MKNTARAFLKGLAVNLSAVVLCLAAGLGTPTGARADEADAKRLLKAMSDYMAAQKVLSFQYDSDLEVVTKENQKITLSSSGQVTMKRPDKIRATRTGGFADVEFLFDGKTVTLFGKDANLYGQMESPGTLDHLVDALREKGRPIPAADLLLSDVYGKLMDNVVDVKDLGSGVIGGVEYDHLAFRTAEVDWEIWIAQGPRPHPGRFVITSTKVAQAPRYSITVRDWKTGGEVKPDDFSFKHEKSAKKVDLANLPNTDDVPDVFAVGGGK
jgi:hypothetical protein